jgi:cyclopropane-fatty-acyl-phospholipid synthase
MLSEFSAVSLTSFFSIMILNKPHMTTSTISGTLRSSVSALLRRTNTLANARLHIAAHYDISNAMFASFLSPDMTYSSAIFRPLSDPLHATESLEDAQNCKLARVISQARIKKSDRVLEIGTGWGSFAIKAAKETGCSVVSLTLSVEQKALAEERIREAGVENLVEVKLCDYRSLKAEDVGLFDKVVSIEMLEAVGKEFISTYFGCIDHLLKKDGGIGVFQCITFPEAVSFYQRRASYC